MQDGPARWVEWDLRAPRRRASLGVLGATVANVVAVTMLTMVALPAAASGSPPADDVAATTTPEPPPTAAATTAAGPAVGLVSATDWMTGIYYSPCDGTAVEVSGGGAATHNGFISVNGVITLDDDAGRALVLLNCRNAGGDLTHAVAQLITVDAAGVRTTYVQQHLAGGGRLISVDPTEIVLEVGAGTPPPGGCCAPFVQRQTVTIGTDRFVITDGAMRPAFHRTLDATTGGGIENVSLVTDAVPRMAACYRWGNTAMTLTQPNPTGAILPPDAELTTMRLALIHLTGMWIEPAPYMNADMDAAARAFQAANGLAVDGIIGAQTKTAVRGALECPETRAFVQVDPRSVGPRTFGSPAELAAAAERYADEGTSGNPALDELLALARWDGVNSYFLGCDRRTTPSNGVTCSWSGATPLQLVGLATDGGNGPVTSFAILYARSAAPSG